MNLENEKRIVIIEGKSRGLGCVGDLVKKINSGEIELVIDSPSELPQVSNLFCKNFLANDKIEKSKKERHPIERGMRRQ